MITIEKYKSELLILKGLANKLEYNHKFILGPIVISMAVPPEILYLTDKMGIPSEEGKIVFYAQNENEINKIKMQMKDLYHLKQEYLEEAPK